VHGIRPFAQLAAASVVAIVLVACGGDGGSASSSKTPDGSGHGGTPPAILMFTIVDSTGLPWATATQGQTGVLIQVALQSTTGVPLASMETTTVDASGNRVAPVTTTSLAGQQFGSNDILTFMPSALIPQTPGFYTVEGWVTDANGLQSGIAQQTLQVVATASYATVVAETGPGVSSLVQSKGMLYWVETGEDAVRSAPVTGGTAQVLATRMLNPSAMAFFGSNVIWLDDRDGTVTNCTAISVTRVLKETNASGVSSVIASGPSCSGGASQIVLIGSTVYWVSSTSSPKTWVINASPLGGSTSTVRTTTTPIVALAASGTTLYWMENAYPSGMASIYALAPAGSASTVASGFTADSGTFAVDSAAVYYATPNVPATNPPTETLWEQPLSGGAPLSLNAAISVPVKLLSTLNQGGSSVLWISANAISAVPAAGGAVTQLAAVSGVPIDVLYDGSAVDWSEVTGAGQYGESGSISSVPLTGGSTTILYNGGDAPRELAQDLQGRLNWTEGGPVGVEEGFARIARLASGSAVTVVNGVNNAVSVNPNDKPVLSMLSAAPTELLIADQWRIKSLPLTGGVLTTLAAADGGLIGGVTNDGTSVYWDDGSSAVNKVPIAGGPVTVLVSVALVGSWAGPSGPITLAENGQLYWAADDPSSDLSVQILSAPSAAPSTTLDDLITKNGDLDIVSSLVANSSSVYAADTGLSYIAAFGPNAAAALQYSAWQNVPTALALNNTTLYWVGSGGLIGKAALTNVTPQSTLMLLVEDTNGDPYALALDASYVYFVDDQVIRKTPL
jgi:hypothetical protein